MFSGYLLKVMHDENSISSTICLLKLAWVITSAACSRLSTLQPLAHFFHVGGDRQWPVGFLLVPVGNGKISQLSSYFTLF